MKRTGPTKESTRELIVELDKHGKATKGDVWRELSGRLGRARRKRASVNLWRLNRLGRRFKNRIFVVPGKVLAWGEVDSALKVAAFEFSAEARKKIEGAKGEALTLQELIARKPKKSELVIVE